MTRPALWLAVRELAARRRRVALAATAIAAITAAATATELVARAREDAIAARIDAMGPALTVVPRGVSAGELARYELGDAVLPPGAEAAVRAVTGSDLRSVERRLVVHRALAQGVRVPLVGVEAESLPVLAGIPGGVALGSEIARRLGEVSRIAVDERGYDVRSVLPSTGSSEDLAVFMPLGAVQALARIEGTNELRLFLRAGVSPREVEARLARADIAAAVIRRDRGEVAERGAQEALSRHRGVAYAVMAAVAALCLLIAAHLDAAERRVELATLVAIGASRWTVLGALVARSAIVAAAGGALGTLGGVAIAAVQDPAVAGGLVSSWALVAVTVGAALVAGVIAAAPTALAATVRDPVRELQEG